MKQNFKNYIKLGILLFGVSMLLINCEKDDAIKEQEKFYETVSMNDAIGFLNPKGNSSSFAREANENYVTVNTSSISYEEIINSTELLTVVAAETSNENVYSRVLLLNINGNIESVVVSMFSYNNFFTGKFFGELLITDMDGNFINGFKVENGLLISQYLLTSNSSTQSRNENTCDLGWGIACGQDLDEVTIGNRDKVELGDLYTSVVPDYGDEDPFIDAGWSSGGGTNANACPTGYIKDSSDNCILNNADPCNDIDTQINDPAFSLVVEDLKTKTGLQQETGSRQDVNGNFTPLTAINGDRSLKLPYPLPPDMIGFIHTHLDDFNTGVFLPNGDERVRERIRMFSPKDLLKFLELVKNANANGIPISSIYGTMVSSSGVYTLRFTGNVNSINTNFNPDDLKQDYIDLIEEFRNERGFLKFIKDKTGNTGVSLFKIKPNGTIKEKRLKDNGRRETIPCE